MRSWWVPVAVGLAVALVAGAGYAVVRSADPSGVRPVAPPTPVEPSVSVVPPEPPVQTPVPTPVPAPRQVPVVGYQLMPQADRLRLHYYIGVPECYGVVDPEHGVTVIESAEAVRVGLTRTPPPAPADTPCIEVALARSLTIRLDAPLDGRAVVDLATGRRVPRRALHRDVHPDCAGLDARTPGRCAVQRPGGASWR